MISSIINIYIYITIFYLKKSSHIFYANLYHSLKLGSVFNSAVFLFNNGSYSFIKLNTGNFIGFSGYNKSSYVIVCGNYGFVEINYLIAYISGLLDIWFKNYKKLIIITVI